MSGLILFKNNLSRILDGFGRSAIGLYEAGSVKGLFCLRIGRIFAVFQLFGMVLCETDWL